MPARIFMGAPTAVKPGYDRIRWGEEGGFLHPYGPVVESRPFQPPNEICFKDNGAFILCIT